MIKSPFLFQYRGTIHNWGNTPEESSPVGCLGVLAGTFAFSSALQE